MPRDLSDDFVPSPVDAEPGVRVRRPRRWARVALPVVVVTLAGLLAYHASRPVRAPTLFSAVTLEQAISAGGEGPGGGLVLVDATASWCPPCRMMDRTTWLDERVEAWVRANGTAVRLDIDAEGEAASVLRVNAVPTLILFRGGEEVGRREGYQSAGELLGWLEGVAGGG